MIKQTPNWLKFGNDLLDPFWSKGGKSYLGDDNQDGQHDWVGERVRWHLAEMIANQDLVATWYKGSAINHLFSDANLDLQNIIPLVNLRLWYLGGPQDLLSIAEKHIQTKDVYLLSMGSPPPVEVIIGRFNIRYPTGNIAANAATCDARIREMMRSDLEWDQVEGRYTVDTFDDEFEVKGNFDPNADTVICL